MQDLNFLKGSKKTEFHKLFFSYRLRNWTHFNNYRWKNPSLQRWTSRRARSGSFNSICCYRGCSTIRLSQLSVSAADIKSMSDFVPVGYAVTYIFGTIGCAFVLSTLGPKIYGVDLAEESRKIDNASKDALEGKLLNSRAGDVDYRAYIIDDCYIGQTVKAVEHKLATEGIRLFMVRMKRGNDVFRPNEDEIIQKK